jgi:adenylate kinase family enzyme
MRVVILGCAGSGKTTLARRLSQCTGVPVISLDAIWQPHWSERDVPTFRALFQRMHAGHNWINEGNFAQASFDIRLPSATLIIWLERSSFCCAYRVIARVFKPGETHRMKDLAKVLGFIRNFNRINRPRIEAIRNACAADVPVIRLKSEKDIMQFLSSQVEAHNRSRG